MNSLISLKSNELNMVAPNNKDLPVVLFKTNEGIEKRGVRTYEGLLSFRELAEYFQLEPNSDKLNEDLKVQRDVDSPRVNKLKKYWENSSGPVFPGMTIFINALDIIATHDVGGRTIAESIIKSDTCRVIGDGQGRTALIKWLQESGKNDTALDYTISVKFIVTDTSALTCDKAKKIIRQVFADYHVELKKPTKSISKHFNTDSYFTVFVNELLKLDFGFGEIKSCIALHGVLRRGNVWTYDQFTGMILKLLNTSTGNIQKELADDGKRAQLFELCKQFLNAVFTTLPINILDTDNYKECHDNTMFTKAIFANALGYVGQSIFDELIAGTKNDFSDLTRIKMPITSKQDKYWQKSKVTMNDEGVIKIIRGTDKRIASLICHDLRIFPCKSLTA